MDKLLRRVAIIGIAALGLCATSAKADLFNFSYTFADASVVSGSFAGTASGVYVDNISDVSVFWNGIPFSGNPGLQHMGLNTGGSFDPSMPAVVSTDASLNNFLFADIYPTYFGTTNSFYMVSHGTFSSAEVWRGFGGAPGSFDPVIDPSRWSLTNVSAVTAIPEPETYAMLLAGLGFLGFMARRRNLKPAATA